MYGFWHKEGIHCGPSGPPSVECDAAYPYSGLIQHAYLTNKHNHYKKMRGCVTQNSNYTARTPLPPPRTNPPPPLGASGPPSMECDTAYPYSGLIQHAYLTNKHNHYKKMRLVIILAAPPPPPPNTHTHKTKF